MKRRASSLRPIPIPPRKTASKTSISRGATTPLVLVWLCALSAPQLAQGFFRPGPRVTKPSGGPRPSSILPSASRPVRIRLRELSVPRLVMGGAEGEEAGQGESEADDEEGEEVEGEAPEGGAKVRQRASTATEEDERISVPSVDIPEMMDEEERVRLWMAVAKAEGEAVRLERAGKTEEAAAKRTRAEELKREDPYTDLQDQLDDAIKKEEFVKIARLRLIMRKIGVPPNPEMQARAMGKDMDYVRAQAAKQMPGMTSRDSENGSRSGTRSDGSTVSDGYSSKSVTTTHGVRVEVRSQYYPEQSNPLKDQYIFVYKVKITNQTRQTVQLVSRSWEIKAVEASEAPQLVKGPGVVGQQPVLEPGQSFEYSSACPITCAPKEGYQVLGRMKGSYLIVMGAVGEAAFEAKIDPFYLILPQAVLDERAKGKNGGGGGGGEATGGSDPAGNW